MSNKAIISQDEVKKVAELSRIALTDKEEKKFAKELNSILDHFKDLSSVDVQSVEYFNHYSLKENQLRDDKVSEFGEDEKEKIRELFPEKSNDLLKVKTVLNP
ncbi:MAG: Asp-tRNA(Asn)/Glu-tRNA(Gln) amidotransferase subunit GatC [Patescibacteria group bacterium]|nr:Asp-tRNA(Asn)/Glu-tRNA(Gln) amidotransferase subunit GatC [Patescibacteria group bacterium]